MPDHLRRKLARWGKLQRRTEPTYTPAEIAEMSEQATLLAIENGWTPPKSGCQTVAGVRRRIQQWS